MSSPSVKKLRRYELGGLPLVAHIIRQMHLREILTEHLRLSGREAISSVDALVLLVMNLAVAKDPLYELADWIESLDLRPLGFKQRPNARFADDRFGRALDKLFESDRASLQTRLVLAAIRAFGVELNRIHNVRRHAHRCSREKPPAIP